MKGDRFKIYNANDECIGHGFGHTLLGPGEYLVDMDTAEELEADIDVVQSEQRRKAAECVADCKAQDRAQAFTTKAIVWRMFLRDVPDTGEVGDPTVIDQVLYFEAWDEYNTTHELMPGVSPWDLARKVVSKAEQASNAESARRRMILENEKVIEDIENA